MKNSARTISFLSVFIASVFASSIIFLFIVPVAQASTNFNQEINYQGRLTTSSGVAVTNGSYDMRFNLYTVSTGGTPVWSETDCYDASGSTTNCNGTGTDNRVVVNSGLFSILLGSTTPFTGVNFNQVLYLSVEIGGTSSTSPSWDGQMTPRKLLGAVPAAMTAATLNGISDSEFFRNDTTNSTSSSGTFLNVTQTGSGPVAILTGATTSDVFSVLSNGNVGIGTTTAGAALTVVGNGYFSGNATATNLTATGTLNVSGLTTLGNASTTNVTVSGNLVLSGITGTTSCLEVNASGTVSGIGSACGSGGGGAISSVSNSDGTLTISPTTGAVVASLALGHANTWIGQQTFSTLSPIFSTMTSGSILFAGAGGLLSQNNANFFWDATTSSLDIGTTSKINSDVNAGVLNVLATTTNTVNLALFRANTNSFGQVAVVNANNGTTSSADFIVGNNLNDTNSNSYYGDFGINSSNNIDPNYTGLLPNDTYLYSSDGSLDLGTATTTASTSIIRFFTGGLLAADQRMTITSLGYVGIASSSPSNALEVNGSGYFSGNFGIGTTTGTTTIASNLQVNNGSLAYDVPSGVTNIDALQTGALNFDTDAGAVSWADLPLDSTPISGTIESYSAQIGDVPILTVYGESNGSGGVQNTRVGVGTTTPTASLYVAGMNNDNPFIVSSSSGAQYFEISSTGTSTFGGALNVTTTSTSTFTGGIIASCFATSTAGGCITPGSGGGGISLSGTNTWIGQQTFSTLSPIFSTMTSGSILFAGAGGLLSQNNANFFWDATNTALDIGTTSSINSNVNVGEFNVIATTTNEINLALFRANVNNTGQVEVVNANAGTTSTAELLVGNNLNDTNASGYYGDFGINSSANINPSTTGFLANDTYLYSSDSGLDLAAATTSTSLSVIRFFTGGRLISNQRMTITSTGLVAIGTSTPWANLSIEPFPNSSASLFSVASTTSSTFATSSVFTVLSNYNVGIGSSTPGSILSVQQTFGSVLPLLTVASSTSATTTSPILTVLAKGTIGISSSTPGSILSVQQTFGSVLPLLTVASSTSATTTSPLLTVLANGNVGISSSTPGSLFSIFTNSGAVNTTPIFTIASSTSTNSATTTIMTVLGKGTIGIGTTTPSQTLTVVGSVCISQGSGATTSCGVTAGNIYYKTANAGNYDVAEDYQTSDPSLGAGDIVAVDPTSPDHVVMASLGSRVLGVVSTDPGLLLGGADGGTVGTDVVPVALSGRVPIYVSTENGPISIGDSIALSSIPGVGEEAGSDTGDIVGIALEPYDSGGIGTIEVFVNLRQNQNIDFSQFALAASTTAANASTSAALLSDLLVLPSIESQISSLGSEFNSLASMTTMFSSTTASTTASILASSTPFIQSIANSVENMMQGMGTWMVGTVSGTLAMFDRVETQTAAVTNGIEMTDSVTHQIWCLRISNGDWDKTMGSCSTQTGTTATSSTVTTVITTESIGNSVTNNAIISAPVLPSASSINNQETPATTASTTTAGMAATASTTLATTTVTISTTTVTTVSATTTTIVPDTSAPSSQTTPPPASLPATSTNVNITGGNVTAPASVVTATTTSVDTSIDVSATPPATTDTNMTTVPADASSSEQ